MRAVGSVRAGSSVLDNIFAFECRIFGVKASRADRHTSLCLWELLCVCELARFAVDPFVRTPAVVKLIAYVHTLAETRVECMVDLWAYDAWVESEFLENVQVCRHARVRELPYPCVVDAPFRFPRPRHACITAKARRFADGGMVAAYARE